MKRKQKKQIILSSSEAADLQKPRAKQNRAAPHPKAKQNPAAPSKPVGQVFEAEPLSWVSSSDDEDIMELTPAEPFIFSLPEVVNKKAPRSVHFDANSPNVLDITPLDDKPIGIVRMPDDTDANESSSKLWNESDKEVTPSKPVGQVFEAEPLSWVSSSDDEEVMEQANVLHILHFKRHPIILVDLDIVEQGTGKVLRRNVELKFLDKDYNNGVAVSLMATKALEQSNLKSEDYTWREVKQRKEMANGSTEFVEAYFVDSIEHGAFYKVEVVHKQKKIANATSVEPGQQLVDEQTTTSSKAPIQQPSSQGSTSLDVHMANITIKQEIPEEIPPEVKQEINEPSEMDELIALQEQQPTTSSAGIKTAPPPAKRSRVEELKEKREIEAIVKRRNDTSSSRRRSPIDPDTLPIPPGYVIVPDPVQQKPSRSKRVTKRKKQ